MESIRSTSAKALRKTEGPPPPDQLNAIFNPEWPEEEGKNRRRTLRNGGKIGALFRGSRRSVVNSNWKCQRGISEKVDNKQSGDNEKVRYKVFVFFYLEQTVFYVCWSRRRNSHVEHLSNFFCDLLFLCTYCIATSCLLQLKQDKINALFASENP
jgi:hypothetical protein